MNPELLIAAVDFVAKILHDRNRSNLQIKSIESFNQTSYVAAGFGKNVFPLFMVFTMEGNCGDFVLGTDGVKIYLVLDNLSR